MIYSKLRSLIFKFDPETAHDLAIKSLKLNLAPNILRKNTKDEMFKTNFFKKELNNPIGIAAGFDKNAEVYNSLFKLGFGFVEVGTVTPLKQYGNTKPRVFRLAEDEALINRLGFNNLGSEDISKRIRSNMPEGVLGVNIGPNKDSKDRLQDYLIGFKTFHKIADYITVNISSPNTENLRDFHNQSKFDELLSSLQNEKKVLKSNTEIIVKVSPDINEDQIHQVSETLLKNKIKGIIVSNTSENCRDKLKNISKHEKGGVSGKPIELISNHLIKKFYNLLKHKVEIIGVGGVDSGESAYNKFLSGASYIQLYTGMVYQGPNIVAKIKKELKELLINDGVKNYKEIIGKKIQ